MRLPSALIILLTIGRVAPAEDAAALALFPPGARIVLGLRVRGVLESTLARSLTSEIQNASAGWEQIISFAGFDPLHDLDEVLLASTGEGKEAPMLIVARGRFDMARLAAGAKPYHGVPLVNGGQKSGTFGFLDSSTVLTGDLAEVKAAIDRRSSPAKIEPALAARLADYRARYDIWGIAENPAGLAQRLSDAKGPQPWDSIDRFQFGLALSHGLEIAAEVHARSDQDTKELTSSLRLLEIMFKASQPSGQAGKLSIENDAGTLKIALALTEEELQKAIEAQRQKTTAHPAPAPAPAPVRSQPAETKRRPAVQSGDGGTTVVTLPGPR
ncbi:MAG: hypothetical protein C5B51_12445 [Terriglobia bacterium]|nr:MAG: hypothetical protein C5B51_12445 [Terriglobia bacterium]